MHIQQYQARDKEEYTVHNPKRKASFQHRTRLVRIEMYSTRSAESVRPQGDGEYAITTEICAACI
jgi:hypothetical protein